MTASPLYISNEKDNKIEKSRGDSECMCNSLEKMYRISANSFRGNYSFFKVENVEIFIQFPNYDNFFYFINCLCANMNDNK